MAQNADNGGTPKVQKTESSSQKREKEKEKLPVANDSSPSLGASIQPTADPSRNKCRELLQKALMVDKDKYQPQFVSLMAAKIEGIRMMLR